MEKQEKRWKCTGKALEMQKSPIGKALEMRLEMQEKQQENSGKALENQDMTVGGFPIFESPEQAQEYLQKIALERVGKHKFDHHEGHLSKCGKVFDNETLALKNFARLWLYL